ncbi:MAG: glycosyltransferase family 2 protein [Yoonia sp.]|nr:glycosyltransferase family 2 protein [Yoonia sp.]
MLTISIVIPTKDRPNFVRTSVRAALASLPEGGDVIVIDDHGDKQAQDALKDIKDDRLRVLRNTGDRGPSIARNFGVAQSGSDVILFADDDDLLKQGYAAHVLALAQTARYGFCAIDSFVDPPAEIPAFEPQGTTDISTLPFKKQLGGLGCGFWVYRSDFLDVGQINPKLRVNEDTDFSLRLLKAELKGVFENGTGAMIRQHAISIAKGDLGQITKRSKDSERAGYFATILADHADYLEQRPEAQAYLRKRLVKMYAKAGQIRAGFLACKASPALIGYFFVNLMTYSVARK